MAVVQGSPDNIEVTAAGVDKGSALLALADRLGIPHEIHPWPWATARTTAPCWKRQAMAAVMANGMERDESQLADIVSENDCDHDGVAEIFARLSASEQRPKTQK